MYDFFQWQYWIALALVLLILEIFLPGFVLFCLGMGCLGGAVAAFFDLSVNWQLVFFSVGALLSFFLVRPLLMKHFWSKGDLKTNTEALIGQRGKVSQDFDPTMKLGRVTVGGDDWRAETQEGEVLSRGALVEVLRVESNTLIVKPL
jgi:membrane protein implicated in regulation of membrane protease activity